jgi:hypothetical protein
MNSEVYELRFSTGNRKDLGLFKMRGTKCRKLGNKILKGLKEQMLTPPLD